MQETEVHKRLKEAYPAAQIEVIDLSGGSGSKLQVSIKEASFASLNRVQRHQAVMALFAAELKSGDIHAFVIRADH